MVVTSVVHSTVRTAARPSEGLWPLLEEERLLALAGDLERAFMLLDFLDHDVALAHTLPNLVRILPGHQL